MKTSLNSISAALCALAASRAQAAPPELFSQLALHPTDPNQIVLAYVQGGQGLLFSNDGGQSFALRCGSAVSSSFTKSRVPLLLTADGQVLLGTFAGLVRGGSDGCGFGDDAGMSGYQVADLAPHPSDATLAFLATANPADGGATGLVRRNADGTFTPLGTNDTGGGESPSVAMNRLEVVTLPDGGLRFYASALELGAAGEARAILRHSDDEGQTWTSYEVPDAEDARVLLIGADPLDPDRIAIALSRESGPDALLVSADAGQSFARRLEIFELGASSVAPDGRLWVGDAGGDTEYSQPGGLYLFDDFAAEPRKLATYPVRCLGYRAQGDQLFACQRSEFGSVDPESGAFTASVSFTSVGGFVSCGESIAPVCKAQLCDNWCGVLHYASAPLCDAYAEVDPLCGPPARGYGQAAPPGAVSGPGGAGSAVGVSPGVLPADAPPAEAARDDAPPAPTLSSEPAAGGGAACQMGPLAVGTPAAWLAGLCPGLALLSRRARRNAPARRGALARRAPGSCNPHRPARH